MKSNHDTYETKLWKLLEERKLVNLSQYHRRGFIDEVPLFSRQSDVAFLPGGTANDILMMFALKFLNAVIAYHQDRHSFFAAITVWDFSVKPIVPNLFASCDSLTTLEGRLVLDPPKSSFARKIANLVAKRELQENVCVLEDIRTVPGSARVFVAPAALPYVGFVTLDHFRGQALASRE